MALFITVRVSSTTDSQDILMNLGKTCKSFGTVSCPRRQDTEPPVFYFLSSKEAGFFYITT